MGMEQTIKQLKAEFKAAKSAMVKIQDESFKPIHVSPEERERLNTARRAAQKIMAEASVALINAEIAAKNAK